MSALDTPARSAAAGDEPDDEFAFGLDDSAPRAPGRRWHLPESINWPEAIISFVVVVFICGFVFKYLQPSKLFLNSTPSGGDMGAHVWQPAYLRDHLLTHLRLTGWSPDWYAGFPSLVFYFPLPSLMIVLLSWVPFVHYNVAFKLITVLGLLTLPLAAWAFGKLARFRFPGPVILAAATLPYLFSTNFTIYGGNIASTMAGEFGFSLSLSAALMFLGLVARGLETGRYRALASVLLVVTTLCHVLPAIFAVAGALVLAVLRWDRRAWRWMVPVLATGACLAAFWALPFVYRLPYATDMGYGKITAYASNLFPGHQFLLFALAGLGALVSLLRRQKLGMFLAVLAGLSLLVLWLGWPLAPRLWNARVLPFWFLCLYLLAAVGVAEGVALLVEPLKPGPVPLWSRLSMLCLPVVAAIGVWIMVGFPLHGLPGGHVKASTGRYTWLGFTSSANSFIPDWVAWNYSGYQSSGKSRRAEYFGVVQTMAKLGAKDGCGRAMWEYEPELDQMGTPDAFMLLPYWTHSCIGSMEGLYYESSATTPYHFVNASELSLQPSDPVRGLTYAPSPDVTEGVQHLQMLGVKYYMALTPQTEAQADADPDLKLVATSGPWPVSYSSGPSQGVKTRTWKIYEVADSQVVAPLLNQPVVMKGVSKGGQSWLTASMDWYLNPSIWDVPYAASGPRSWARVSPTSVSPPRTPLQPVQVSGIVATDSSVSFNVDTVGVPVLVKTSYFPSWQAHGAQGPWRVAPNLMVVIPTSHHVWLHYGNTPLDWFGYFLGILGLVALVWLARADPVTYGHARRGLGELPVTVTQPWSDQGTTHYGAAPWAGPENRASDPSLTHTPGVVEADARLGDALSAGLTQRLGSNGDDGATDAYDEWLGWPTGAMPVIPPTPARETGATPAVDRSAKPASEVAAPEADSMEPDDTVWLRRGNGGVNDRDEPEARGESPGGDGENGPVDGRGNG